MAAVPLPGGLEDRFDVGKLRLPAEDAAGLLGGGNERCGVARAAAREDGRDFVANDLLGGLEDLKDREADAVAKVEDVALAVVDQVADGEDVGLREIADVDVVAHAGAVPRGVIGAGNRNARAGAVGGLQNDRNEVALRAVVLADRAAGHRAAGVEVAQGDIAQTVRERGPLEHLLHGDLGRAVGVGRLEGVRLQNRGVDRLAVGRGGGGEDDFVDVVGDHAREKDLRAADIVAVILEGVGHALANEGIGGEVDDRVDGFRLENGVKEDPVANIADVQAHVRRDGLAVTRLERVRDHDFKAAFHELANGVGADIARAAEH